MYGKCCSLQLLNCSLADTVELLNCTLRHTLEKLKCTLTCGQVVPAPVVLAERPHDVCVRVPDLKTIMAADGKLLARSVGPVLNVGVSYVWNQARCRVRADLTSYRSVNSSVFTPQTAENKNGITTV